LAKILSHSCLELGDQFTLNMSLSPLHINCARQQLKKIWSTSSGLPHNAQLPFEGPLLRRIWSFDGNLPLANCHYPVLTNRRSHPLSLHSLFLRSSPPRATSTSDRAPPSCYRQLTSATIGATLISTPDPATSSRIAWCGAAASTTCVGTRLWCTATTRARTQGGWWRGVWRACTASGIRCCYQRRGVLLQALGGVCYRRQAAMLLARGRDALVGERRCY
jgi:hypothetical protein